MDVVMDTTYDSLMDEKEVKINSLRWLETVTM